MPLGDFGSKKTAFNNTLAQVFVQPLLLATILPPERWWISIHPCGDSRTSTPQHARASPPLLAAPVPPTGQPEDGWRKRRSHDSPSAHTSFPDGAGKRAASESSREARND